MLTLEDPPKIFLKKKEYYANLTSHIEERKSMFFKMLNQAVTFVFIRSLKNSTQLNSTQLNQESVPIPHINEKALKRFFPMISNFSSSTRTESKEKVEPIGNSHFDNGNRFFLLHLTMEILKNDE